MKIKDIIQNDRPRERFLNFGPTSLSNAELLAIIIGTGSKEINAIETSNEIIKTIGLEKIKNATIYELTKIKGIGKIKAIKLKCIFEILKRTQKKEDQPKIICSAKDVYNYFKDDLLGKKKEYFYTLLLNSRNEIIKKDLVSIGTLNMSVVHPREVFKNAIKESANSIILVHNHPSNSGEPSTEDITTTQEIVKAGNLLQIKVLDHVIIHDNGWNSII
ncbi:DNA repair protein RadC [Candidatus Woesearchaeota archaeon]|nr:DNA repair protein RadC [Candidatus Woesearchaeota archaeon]